MLVSNEMKHTHTAPLCIQCYCVCEMRSPWLQWGQPQTEGWLPLIIIYNYSTSLRPPLYPIHPSICPCIHPSIHPRMINETFDPESLSWDKTDRESFPLSFISLRFETQTSPNITPRSLETCEHTTSCFMCVYHSLFIPAVSVPVCMVYSCCLIICGCPARSSLL